MPLSGAEPVRAAVCIEHGQPLVVEEVLLAPPGPGEVELKVAACAVCHSDVSYAAGAWGGALPAVYGHEAAGVVARVGDGVAGVRPGQRALVTLVRSCGACYFCARGQPALCETRFALDELSPLRTARGAPIEQGLRTGAFAERVVVHESQLVALPDEVPLDCAALLACGVLTGFGAVVNTARVEERESVVVVGAGGVGLNSVQAAAGAGAAPVVAVDPDGAKRQAALAFGASHVLDPAACDLGDAVRELTGGRGADHVIVTVGLTSAIESGLGLLRRGGGLVVVGMPEAGALAAFDPGGLAHDGRRILGSKLGSARPAVDVPKLVALYLDGRLELHRLISGRYGLDEVNEALSSAARGGALRNVLVLDAA